jgi:hypothetical protein
MKTSIALKRLASANAESQRQQGRARDQWRPNERTARETDICCESIHGAGLSGSIGDGALTRAGLPAFQVFRPAGCNLRGRSGDQPDGSSRPWIR